jgi:hypothetical protein
MGSPFSQINREFSLEMTLPARWAQILGNPSFLWGQIRNLGTIAPNPLSDGYFGEDIHAADLGCNPKLRSIFYPHDRRLAADPALFA